MSQWRLNGDLLGTSNVTVLVDPGVHPTRAERIHRSKTREGQTNRHAGQDSPLTRLTFKLVGPKPHIYHELGHIIDKIEDGQVWTLQVPSGTDLRLWKDHDRIALLTEEIGQPLQAGINSVELEVRALIEGVWVTDDGEYAEVITEAFEKTDTGWERVSDGAEFTDAEGPRVRLPEQIDGYPKGVRQATLEWEHVKPADFEREDDRHSSAERVFELVDAEEQDLLHPPSGNLSTGDTARVRLRSVPTNDWLRFLPKGHIITQDGDNVVTQGGDQIIAQPTFDSDTEETLTDDSGSTLTTG